MKEVFDTRFLAEYFYSDDTQANEKIRRKMKELIAKREGIIPTIVIAEITRITCDRIGKDAAESRYSALVQSGLQIQELTASIAKVASLLKSKYKNLPMGDCIIAATAITNQARIISDDPHFDNIKETKCTWI